MEKKNSIEWTHKLNVNTEYTEIDNSNILSCNELTSNSEIILSVDYIPKKKTIIKDYGFVSCFYMEKFNCPENLKKIGRTAFAFCKKLKRISLPNSVVSIGKYAFDNCSSLEEINIPENITIINSFTFYKCSELKEIKLSSNIANIGERAFFKCTSLKKVVMKSIQPPNIGIKVFADTHPDLKIYVPLSVLFLYKEKWKEYSDIIVINEN